MVRAHTIYGTSNKEEIKTLNEKLKELTEEELAQVTGGSEPT